MCLAGAPAIEHWSNSIDNDEGKQILELLGSKHFTTPAYTPRINGIVERSHQNMATTLRLLVFELIKYSPQRWGELLPCLQYHLRHHRVGQSQATPYR